MTSQASSLTIKGANGAQMCAAIQETKEDEKAHRRNNIESNLLLIIAQTLPNEPTTFSWKCSSIQPNSYSTSCLLNFFMIGISCSLKWHQALCFEKELENQPSLEQLLPRTTQASFKALMRIRPEVWTRCARAIRPKLVTVIPQGDIRAVQFSLNPIPSLDITHCEVCLIWPDGHSMILWKNISINKNTELHPLMASNTPVLVIVMPGGELTPNCLGQLVARNSRVVDFFCRFTMKYAPCAFLLNVAPNAEGAMAAVDINKEPLSCFLHDSAQNLTEAATALETANDTLPSLDKEPPSCFLHDSAQNSTEAATALETANDTLPSLDKEPPSCFLHDSAQNSTEAATALETANDTLPSLDKEPPSCFSGLTDVSVHGVGSPL